jgi:aryl-alcohol dehydrogenase-like predicted oxidoreductase
MLCAFHQVQYSLVDTRPGVQMAALCEERGVSLLTYGTLLGGYVLYFALLLHSSSSSSSS